jgi:hypothetical protein
MKVSALLGTRFPFAPALSLFAALLGFARPAYSVGTRHFVFESAKDFEGGESEGVFLDSLGGLRPGLSLLPTAAENTPVIWAAFATKNEVLLATGNEGKLLALRGGKITELAQAKTVALTSIAEAWGRTFVGTLSSGEILELKNGRLVPFAKLGESLIWALSFDSKTGSLFAATGPQGQVFRITSDGASQVYFDADESHVVSLASAGGTLYAGSSGKARLYRVLGPGRAEVLRDFGKTEVRAILAQESGEVFCIVNELKGSPRSDTWKPDRPAPASTGEPNKGSGELYRFLPDGRAERLLDEKEEFFTALALSRDREPWVGTGLKARVLAVRPRLESRQIADLEERQVGAIVVRPGGADLVVASDPGVVYDVQSLGSRHGSYTSAALDAGLRARFGTVRMDASSGVEVQFRSGNTDEPGQFWSDWSPPVSSGEEPKVPRGRFLQFKVTMPAGPDRTLRRIEIPFVTDNLKATVQKITADLAALPKTSKGLKSSGGPIEGAPSPKLKVSFEVDNPDEDDLHYRVEYASSGSNRWFDALEPGTVLLKNSFTWDTSALAEGEYRLRVTASDELSNGPDQAEKHWLESGVILVDNTAPQLIGWKWADGTLSGGVTDGLGPVRRVEVRIDGSEEWFPLGPADGILDERSEEFRVKWNADQTKPVDTLTVRAFDAALNSSVQIVKVAP